MKATLLRLSILVAACAVLASCGIDSFATLVNDPISVSNFEKAIVFEGPAAPEPEFLGVVIFYRVYDSLDDAIADRGYVISKQSAENAVPGSIIESYLASSGGLNYHKPVLVNAGGSQIVRIPIIFEDDLPLGQSYVTIEFPSTAVQTLSIIDTAASTTLYTLRRGALDPSGNYSSFGDEPISGNTDYRSSSAEDDHVYHVQFFAASYGIDFVSLNELYGDAVYIGTIVMNF